MMITAARWALWIPAAVLWLVTVVGLAAALSVPVAVFLGKTEDTLAAVQVLFMLAVTAPIAFMAMGLSDWLVHGALLGREAAAAIEGPDASSSEAPPNYL